MALSDLLQFISHLESDGELSRVSVSVDPILEIATITNRVSKQPRRGEAPLFEHPADRPFIDFTDDIFHDRGTDRVAVDATGCRLLRPEVNISAEFTDLVTSRWKEYKLP